MKFEGRFWTAAIVVITAACAWWIFEGRFRTTMIISLMDERAHRLETCAWWVCWPSASSDDRYYRERWEERGGLAASMIGFEDRLYADLYKRALADEYVNEAWGSPRAEGQDKNVEMAEVYCRKKDATTELERGNGINVEMTNYGRGMKFAICMEHALEDVPWAKKCHVKIGPSP